MTRRRGGSGVAWLALALAVALCPPPARDPFARPRPSSTTEVSQPPSRRLAGVIRAQERVVELVEIGDGPGLIVRHGAATPVRPWSDEPGPHEVPGEGVR